MKTRRILLLVVCGLCLTGCKSGKQNQELLERELRYQEERIYELEDAARSGCRSGARMRPPRLAIAQRPTDGRWWRPNRLVQLADHRFAIRFWSLATGAVLASAGELRHAHRGTGRGIHARLSEGSGLFGATSRAIGVSRICSQQNKMTGGASQLTGGEDGIVVVFEPRNARGEMVAEPGDVSIALVDPLSGAGPRLAGLAAVGLRGQRCLCAVSSFGKTWPGL